MELMKTEQIKSRIFFFWDLPVIIDGDLAGLHGVGTEVLNQAVKRKIGCFPDSFRFSLSEEKKQQLVTNCDRFENLKQSHDRFLIIDQKDLYQTGASMRDFGKKPVVSETEPWFTFSKMSDLLPELLAKLPKT